MVMLGGPHRFSDSGSWIKRHSLGLALILVFVVQAIIVIVTGWPQFVSDAQMHSEAVKIMSFIIWFTYEMTVSIIADTYGALLLVFFSKWFYEQGSAESK